VVAAELPGPQGLHFKPLLEALADHFRREGPKVIERVAKTSLQSNGAICALLVPKEMKAQHFGGLSALTDEELDAALVRCAPEQLEWIDKKEVSPRDERRIARCSAPSLRQLEQMRLCLALGNPDDD
jgi:hypothetical protein